MSERVKAVSGIWSRGNNFVPGGGKKIDKTQKDLFISILVAFYELDKYLGGGEGSNCVIHRDTALKRVVEQPVF